MKILIITFLNLTTFFAYSEQENFETKLDSLAEIIDFDYKTGELKNEKNLFKKIAFEILKSEPKEISIEAHTDSRGKMEDNIVLSKKVAESVKILLIEFGISSEFIITKGWVESRPRGCIIDPRKNRDWNRRIEIILR